MLIRCGYKFFFFSFYLCVNLELEGGLNANDPQKEFCLFQAVSFIINNPLRVVAVNTVGDFVLFLGKVGVMAATAAIGVLWFKVRWMVAIGVLWFTVCP